MDGIQDHPEESGRRNYSNNGQHEMVNPPGSAFQRSYPPPTTQTSNTKSRFSHESISFNALPLNDPSYPLSRPATEWSGSPLPSASTQGLYSPSHAISTNERANRLHTSTAVTKERFQITIHDLTGRAFILNEITSSLKISKLKEKLEAKEGIPTYDQKLIFEGKELIDGTVYFYLLLICR
jgi:hypothetical protein